MDSLTAQRQLWHKASVSDSQGLFGVHANHSGIIRRLGAAQI